MFMFPSCPVFVVVFLVFDSVTVIGAFGSVFAFSSVAFTLIVTFPLVESSTVMLRFVSSGLTFTLIVVLLAR